MRFSLAALVGTRPRKGSWRSRAPSLIIARSAGRSSPPGTDTLRVADGQLAEYWANAGSLPFFQQLGVREVPARG